MLSAVVAGLAFSPSLMAFQAPSRSGAVVMQEGLSRRQLVQSVGAATALMPFAAFADGANSKATIERAKGIYGSRIARLASASPAEVLDEANAFTLYITGTCRSVDKKDQKKTLTALAKKITTSAKAGDAAATTAGVKEFIAAEKLTELDRVKGNNWDPRQRRNPGAPPTSEIEAQMGTEAFALYAPVKGVVKDYGL